MGGGEGGAGMNVKFIGFELKRKKENIKNSKEREGMNKIQRNYFKKNY